MPAPTQTAAIDALASDIREVEGLLEMHTADEVIGYLAERPYAAAECLATDGHLHAACMSQGRADSLFALADRAAALAA